MEFLSPRTDILTNIVLTMAEFLDKYRFIVVHGAGSFAHPYAKAFHLKNGYKSPHQIFGVTQTHESMLDLNSIILEVGQQFQVPFLSFPPLTSCVASNGRIKTWDLEPLRRALDLGFIPITFGDVVFDVEQSFCILSGDQIVPYIAGQFPISKILMLTDVDGVFSKNPKTNPEARKLDILNLNDKKLLKEIFGTAAAETKVRVTGEMEKKLEELIPSLKSGVETWVGNGMDTNLLRAHLEPQSPDLGTKIVFS